MHGAMAVPMVGLACLVLVGLSELADAHPWVNWIILAIILPPLIFVGSCMIQGPRSDQVPTRAPYQVGEPDVP